LDERVTAVQGDCFGDIALRFGRHDDGATGFGRPLAAAVVIGRLCPFRPLPRSSREVSKGWQAAFGV
jgi:hypothetical protein